MRRTEQSRDASIPLGMRGSTAPSGSSPSPAMRILNSMFDVDCPTFDRNLSLVSTGVIREKTLPDRFVGITGFTPWILLPHIFQRLQKAISTGIGCAHCAGNLCQPWRRRFFFEIFRCGLPFPIQWADVYEAHAVEDIEHWA